MIDNLNIDQQIAIISAGAALLGSLIGAIATLLGTWLTKKMQESGKITLFVKPVFSHSDIKNWSGFYRSQTESGLSLQIPVWLDVCNTSGISRIVRNINLYAYKGKKEIAPLTQIQRFGDGEKAIPLGDHESYTLVVPANSAKRFNLEFMLHEQDIMPDQKDFDELILSYFDEHNKIHAFHFSKVDSCWVEGQLSLTKEWIPMEKRCRYAR